MGDDHMTDDEMEALMFKNEAGPQHPMGIKRMVVQIVKGKDDMAFALCDDGTLWRVSTASWVRPEQIEIPQK